MSETVDEFAAIPYEPVFQFEDFDAEMARWLWIEEWVRSLGLMPPPLPPDAKRCVIIAGV